MGAQHRGLGRGRSGWGEAPAHQRCEDAHGEAGGGPTAARWCLDGGGQGGEESVDSVGPLPPDQQRLVKQKEEVEAELVTA